jgi:RNA polymerase sigma factor (sigma-70 family)
MATKTLGTVLQHLRRSSPDREAGPADGDLLERFLAGRDEAAFEALVWRHGPMVLGVCRRLLGNEADAEDAFQATFLVLAKKAASVRPRGMVGSWLFGVARNLARKAKAMNTRRRAREREAAARPRPGAADARQHLVEALDEELGRLPDRYRAAIVLCDLEGATIKEAARQLSCPAGTLGARLTRGRALLARRLARRGLPLSGASVATLLSLNVAPAAVPVTLVASTVQAAGLLAAGRAAAGLVSSKVVVLLEGAVNEMLLTRMKTALALALVLCALASGLAVLAQPERQAAPATVGSPGAKPAPARPRRSAEVVDMALRAAEKVEDPFRKARALSLVAKAQHRLGDGAACRKTIRKALAVAAAMSLEDPDDSRYKFHALEMIAWAQADTGDFAGARKTADQIRKSDVLGARDLHRFPRAWALLGIAQAQARAGKLDDALRTARDIEDGESGKGLAFLAVVKALAKAKRWDRALATAALIDEKDMYRSEAFSTVARLQARAGDRATARRTLEKALAAAEKLPAEGIFANNRAFALLKVAEVQLDLGEEKAAARTLASIPERLKADMDHFLLSRKVEVRDFKGALEAAEKLPPARTPWDVWSSRDAALAGVAVAQARAGDFKGAEETLDKVRQQGGKISASAGVAVALARAGQKEKAARLVRAAVPDAEAVGADKGWADDVRLRVQQLAAAQAEAGEEKAVLAWIAKLPSAFTRTFALLGVAEGAAAREGKGARLRLFGED